MRDERVEILTEDVGNLERELRSKRAQIKQLRREQDRALKSNAHYDDAMMVLRRWKSKLSPNARELGGKRLEQVIARLTGGYSPDDLMRAVDGYAFKPFVVDRRRAREGGREDWHADAELIFRDPQKVDAGIRLCAELDALEQALSQPAQNSPPTTSGQERGPMLEAALRYAKHGWAVMPCQPRGKAPATRNGLLDASMELPRVERFWAAHPEHNVAVVTGRRSGVIVLDVDGDVGGESLAALEKAYGKLPDTASVVTPRGGSHFYFRHPGPEVKNTTGFPGTGLDVRGDGGYVLAVPSVGPNGRRYEPDAQVPIADAPAWLLRLLTQRQQAIKKGKLPGEWEAMLSKPVTSGNRNSTLTSYVGLLFNQDDRIEVVRAQAHVYNDGRIVPKLPAREVDQVVDHIARARSRQ